MAAENSTWRAWLREQLGKRDWRPADLTRHSDGQVDSSQLTRWLKHAQTPTLESVRVVCAAFDVPVVEGLLAAGFVQPDDLQGVKVVTRTQPLEDWSDEEFVAEFARRLARTRTDELTDRRHRGEFTIEWPKANAPTSRNTDTRDDEQRA